MNVVEVIPILRGLPKAALTYFSGEEVEPGQFVEIEVHGQAALGLVSRVENAREVKTSLKKSTYSLKKLRAKSAELGIPRSLAQAASRAAEYYVSTVGSVLAAVIPKLFLAETELLRFNIEEPARPPREPVLIQLEREERFAAYKAVIRERFARGESVLFVAPSNELAKRAHEELSRGIESYAHLFTLALSKKSIKESLRLSQASPHPVLFITTPSGLVWNRADLSTVILEAENSSWRTRTRPFISYKALVEFYAEERGLELVMGDSVLSIETLWKGKRGAYAEFAPLKWRITSPAETQIVDMKKRKDEEGKFQIFSAELRSLVASALSGGDQIFLFGARKGLSSTTVCGDCGSILPCQNCGAPVVLHKKSDTEQVYVCHACGALRPAETKCDTCSSWKLTPLGVGIERIADEARALWPGSPVFIFDKDHLETPAAARALAKSIRNAGPSIIVGSELFTLYREEIAHAAVVSMDSLFAIPDFGIHERIFSLVTRIREMTTRNLLIQTRNIGKEILAQAAKGDILGFYRAEIADRQAFSYPPFSIFIKVSATLPEPEIAREASAWSELFGLWNPDFLKIRGQSAGDHVFSMIIRLAREDWPEKALLEKLALLGPEITVKVDPESIL